jgi:hypothetical protein
MREAWARRTYTNVGLAHLVRGWPKAAAVPILTVAYSRKQLCETILSRCEPLRRGTTGNMAPLSRDDGKSSREPTTF